MTITKGSDITTHQVPAQLPNIANVIAFLLQCPAQEAKMICHINNLTSGHIHGYI